MPAPLIWAQLFCTTQQSGHPSCLYESTVVFCSWRQATISQKRTAAELTGKRLDAGQSLAAGISRREQRPHAV